MMIPKKFIISPLVAAASTVPLAALAAATVSNVCDILRIVDAISKWFSYFVFILAVIIILYAAFLFVTAAGNEESQKKAKTFLIYGIIGIAVGLLAFNAVSFVQSIVGGSLQSGCVTL